MKDNFLIFLSDKGFCNTRLSIILGRNGFFNERILISPNMTPVNFVKVDCGFLEKILIELTGKKTLEDFKFFQKFWSNLNSPTLPVKIEVFSYSENEKKFLKIRELSFMEIGFLLERAGILFSMLESGENRTVIMSDIFSVVE